MHKGPVELLCASAVPGDGPRGSGLEVSVEGGDGVQQCLGGAPEVEVRQVTRHSTAEPAHLGDRLFVKVRDGACAVALDKGGDPVHEVAEAAGEVLVS